LGAKPLSIPPTPDIRKQKRAIKWLICLVLPARASHEAEVSGDSRVERRSLRGKPFNLQQTFAAICASGIVPPSIIDSEFLERLR